MGKLAGEELKKLLSCIRSDPRVIVPPLPGYDAGVHLMGNKYLVVATDPCIGVPEDWFGWLLVNYAASDVALFGANPEFCTITLLGPTETSSATFQSLMKQVCRATRELDMAIVRGHTGTYAEIETILGVCTAYGTTTKNELITPGNAKSDDLILCTKSLGLETLANLACANKTKAESIFGKKTTQKLAASMKAQSCIKEALLLAKIPGVHALHDATEGGATAAINEMADASLLGFRVQFEKIPVSTELLGLQKHFKLTTDQILSSSSTGTIIASVDPKAKKTVEDELFKIGVPASFIGTFTRKKSRQLNQKGKPEQFPLTPDDPYERILSGKV